MRLPGLPMPFLGILGTRERGDGWEHTAARRCVPYMPMYGRCEVLDRRRPLRPHRATRPRQFDGARVPRAACARDDRDRSVHGKIDLALHHLRPAPDADGRRHAAAAAPPRPRRGVADRGALVRGRRGPGRSRRSTSRATVGSTMPHGGGYTAEILLADADAALGALTVDDPDAARSRCSAGGSARTSPSSSPAPGRRRCTAPSSPTGPGSPAGRRGRRRRASSRSRPTARTPDPYALVELGRDLRPPDYAASFVRLALAGSPSTSRSPCTAMIRPEWLDAVANEHGVMDVPLAEALTAYVA